MFTPTPTNLPASNPGNSEVRYAGDGDAIYGLLVNPAPRASLVVKTVAADGTEGLAPANGQRGLNLERDVVTDIPFIAFEFMQDFVLPDMAGTAVTARRVKFLEVEGPDLLVLSGTGALSGATAVNTPLGSVAVNNIGMYRVQQNGDELQGWVRGQKPAQGDGTFRLVIEHAL